MSDSQSPPSSPRPASATAPTISPDALAAAAERRTREQPAQKTTAQLAHEHERKQKFRRMIDPGIVRPNPKEQAISSLKTLLKIAENLLNDPENPKYQAFKPTNSVIKRELVDRKGVLEYAIELGFRGEVENFQPYYRWHPRHLEELRVGTDILKEFVDLFMQKEAAASVKTVSQKELQRQAAERVRLAYMDDRKTKEQRDEMERQVRLSRGSSAQPSGPARARIARPAAAASQMPGEGEMLVSPPPYEAPPSTDSEVHTP
ncbi:hypothetical protein DFP72DRAFT_878379 [Ephemerocybe angulata]|uniref:PUB domain-containing protein n=1 Tax=Ephemerocybe angulata TaxID=980116 RepID=A0A8H6ID21_9AGAR|nr:hypothetical protein DFP72DRAFT_878379 [Tulosesus angulatus]